jgi:hypothetical protein
MNVDETRVFEGIEEIAASLRSLDSPDAATSIEDGWSCVQEWMAREGLSSLEYQCYTTSRLLMDQFKKFGVAAGILEGDIEIGPHDYLEHRANLIRAENFFAFVDLASRQFGRADGFMLVSPPSAKVLKAALEEEYHWF